MTNNEVLDYNQNMRSDRAGLPTIKVSLFLVLYLMTLGFYAYWWCYKVWRYLQRESSYDLMPFLRSLFTLLFLYELFIKIQTKAHQQGYSGKFPASLLYIGFILSSLFAQSSSLLFLLFFLGGLCFVQPVSAVNHIMRVAEQQTQKTAYSFKPRHIIAIVLGLSLWGLMILGAILPLLY